MNNASFHDEWPPRFTIDQERVLNLLTGDRFYSNSSAALREAILNAIDAVYRRRLQEPSLAPSITVTFNRSNQTLIVDDNGDGMDPQAMIHLFTQIGASAAELESGRGSVGEFGIGVISYFMAGDSFSVQTFDGSSERIGLKFTRQMLTGGIAKELPASRDTRGTTVEINIRDDATFKLLLESFPHWCRDVSGLTGSVQPDGKGLNQGGLFQGQPVSDLPAPQWVEHAHLSPVSSPTGWEAMSGESTIAILYRGVFVQQFTVRRLWGIEGSIDVDPKHFKTRLNREGFIEGQFQAEVEQFLKQSHPLILKEMAHHLSRALRSGDLDKWTERRWATLWLSIPRDKAYEATAEAWDAIFRGLPAFELAVGNRWEPYSLEQLIALEGPLYVAPLPDEKRKPTDLIDAALRLLRHTRRNVIRGLRRDRGWLRDAGNYFETTADLIIKVFATEIPELIPLTQKAESILAEVAPLVTLFKGDPSVDLVRISSNSPPVLRLRSRLILNIDNRAGRAIVDEALDDNKGPWSLITITARHSHEHVSQVAAAVKDASLSPERLGLVKRRFIRGFLS